MSLYCEVETTMTNQAALLEALADMGFTKEKVEVHTEPQRLHGYQFQIDGEKAEIIIRRKFAKSLADIGFAKQKNGSYRIMADQDDLGRYGTAWLNKLKQNYSIHTTLQWAKRKRLKVKTEQVASGAVRIVMESY